jgi:hypothetical protein
MDNAQDFRAEDTAGDLQEHESQQQPPIIQGETQGEIQVNLGNEPVQVQVEQQTAQENVGEATTANESSMPQLGMNNPLLASAYAGFPFAPMAGFPGLDAQGNLVNPHMFMFPGQPQLPMGVVPGGQPQLPAASMPPGPNGRLPGLVAQPASSSANESNSQTETQQGGPEALPNINMAPQFAGYQMAALQQLMLQQQRGPPVDPNVAGMMMYQMPMPMMGCMPPNLAHIGGTKSPAICLGLSVDDEHLSEYQILIRKQLEVFEAQQDDAESNTQGRKKSVTVGQVGLRCRHCAGLPLRQRGKGAVYYPTKLQGIYQAAQNMANSHLSNSCQYIDEKVKADIKTLRERRDTASGGKKYWADGARALGIYEAPDGLRLSHGGGGGGGGGGEVR